MVVNALTAAKLIPLVIFIVAGLFAMDASRLALDQPLTLGAAASSGLLLIFGFGGYEVCPWSPERRRTRGVTCRFR